MPKNDRKTLKRYFENGRLPTEDHFADLIDSTLNLMDDGFDRSVEDGLEVAQLSDSGKLISFFKYVGDQSPLWFIRVDDNENLILGNPENEKVLLLVSGKDGQKSKIGINNKEPENELHVGGVIRAEGRIGVATKVDKEELTVPADGKWHDITGELRGCQAFEVMAGVGGKRYGGQYALMHAFALNTYNPKGPLFNFLNFKKRIRYHQAYYRSRSDKLKLRWDGTDGRDSKYRLQLKSNTDYGDDQNGKKIHIKYYITKLWFDDDMSGSRSGRNSEV